MHFHYITKSIIFRNTIMCCTVIALCITLYIGIGSCIIHCYVITIYNIIIISNIVINGNDRRNSIYNTNSHIHTVVMFV